MVEVAGSGVLVFERQSAANERHAAAVEKIVTS